MSFCVGFKAFGKLFGNTKLIAKEDSNPHLKRFSLVLCNQCESKRRASTDHLSPTESANTVAHCKLWIRNKNDQSCVDVDASEPKLGIKSS